MAFQSTAKPGPRRIPLAPIAATGRAFDDQRVPSSPLADLIKLPAGDRAEVAMALRESLSDAERAGALELSDVDRAELDGAGQNISRTQTRQCPGRKCGPSS